MCRCWGPGHRTDTVTEQHFKQVGWAWKEGKGAGKWTRLFWVEDKGCAEALNIGSGGKVTPDKDGAVRGARISSPASRGKIFKFEKDVRFTFLKTALIKCEMLAWPCMIALLI